MSGQGITSSTEDRALTLLGQGIGPEQVAMALGVSASRISQLLSQEEFAIKVAEARYTNLAAHNERDSKYNSMEDQILDRLKEALVYVFQPMQLVKILQVLNLAKRRGTSTPEAITAQQTVLVLNIPTVVINKFTTNINNQVVEAGAQKLVTIQSGTLMDRIKEKSNQDVQDVLESTASQGTGVIEHEPQRSITHRETVGVAGNR